MPKPSRECGVLGHLLLWGIMAALIAVTVLVLVATRGWFGIVVLLAVLALWRRDRRINNIAAQRAAESLCTFARSFDCRKTDTWIVRAVFEEISACVPFPPRRGDRLQEDLRIDPEDIEDIVEVVALRTGRPLDACERNPRFGRVKTVGDMVEFFSHQPKGVPAAA